MPLITRDYIRYWESRYPIEYDVEHYDPYIANARVGNICALRKVTEWKNVGTGNRPMRLSTNKEKSFQKLLSNLKAYTGPGGSACLRRDFQNTTPVYSIFWHHVLFETPIFDVYTNISFQYETRGIFISKEQGKIHPRNHWILYDQYAIWFNRCLADCCIAGGTISARSLDRALFMWGKKHS